MNRWHNTRQVCDFGNMSISFYSSNSNLDLPLLLDTSETLSSEIRVAFNHAAQRKDCRFHISIPDPTVPGHPSGHLVPIEFNESSNPADLFQSVGVIAPFVPHSSPPITKAGDPPMQATVQLVNVYDLPSSSRVTLPDRDVIALDEECDEIYAFIRRDQNVMRDLEAAVKSSVHAILQNPALQAVKDIMKEHNSRQERDAEVLSQYRNQRIWGYVCRGIVRGVKDQSTDFNQPKLAVIPASWTVKVEGRPEPVPDAELKDDVQIDTVCMCCFDGVTSDEHNKIIFCDGCNTAVHQMCYGVHDIPEGDFYCDRCLFVKELSLSGDYANELDELKDVARCCLCPLYHGGLKRTRDGQWVHLCCAFWSKKSIICDLQHMAPVDVSHAPIAVPAASDAHRRRSHKSLMSSSHLEDSFDADMTRSEHFDLSRVDSKVSDNCEGRCLFCKSGSGYLQSCGDRTCGHRFHSLCAWFAGLYFETILDDSTCLGAPSNGQYPSGLDFNIYCKNHSPTDPSNAAARIEEQKAIRMRYQLNVDDLCCIPGKAPKKRKSKKKSIGNGANKRSANQSKKKNVNELPIDTYTDTTCAICYSPTHRMLPSQHPGSVPNTLSCSHCRITVHRSCVIPSQVYSVVGLSDSCRSEITLDHLRSSDTAAADTWMCERCSKTVSVVTGVEEVSEIRCELCPRRGGVFMRLDTEDRYVHQYCHMYRPSVRSTSVGSTKDIPVVKKTACVYCNLNSGLCAKCSYPGGCTHHFHPICAVRSGAFLRIREGQREQYCHKHIPETVFQLPNGYWIDTAEISNLRKSLDMARIILDLVKAREKIKKKSYHSLEEAQEKKIDRTYRKLLRSRGLSSSLDDGHLSPSVDTISDGSDDEPEESPDLTTPSLAVSCPSQDGEPVTASEKKRGRPRSKSNLLDDSSLVKETTEIVADPPTVSSKPPRGRRPKSEAPPPPPVSVLDAPRIIWKEAYSDESEIEVIPQRKKRTLSEQGADLSMSASTPIVELATSKRKSKNVSAENLVQVNEKSISKYHH
jgi:hypothetical protein